MVYDPTLIRSRSVRNSWAQSPALRNLSAILGLTRVVQCSQAGTCRQPFFTTSLASVIMRLTLTTRDAVSFNQQCSCPCAFRACIHALGSVRARSKRFRSHNARVLRYCARSTQARRADGGCHMLRRCGCGANVPVSARCSACHMSLASNFRTSFGLRGAAST